MATLERFLAPTGAFAASLFPLAARFVAGSTIAAAIETVRGLNERGMLATLDYLGEDVATVAEAQATRDAYLALLADVERSGVRTNVSVKLSALGLGIDPALCERHLDEIVARASGLPDPFVRIDMEGSAVTDATLRVFDALWTRSRNVGPVLQAYLRRTAADVERAIEIGARVRLCKGAYAEPESLAYAEMYEIRRAYLRHAEALLERGTYPAIATHDERLVDACTAIAKERGIGRERFEFQLLYGVRPDLQERLVREGYTVRIYVPFGTHWAPYFYRRITERKENALFAMRSMLAR